jgi:hypothetical protein
MSPETPLFLWMGLEMYAGWINERIIEAGWIDR